MKLKRNGEDLLKFLPEDDRERVRAYIETEIKDRTAKNSRFTQFLDFLKTSASGVSNFFLSSYKHILITKVVLVLIFIGHDLYWFAKQQYTEGTQTTIAELTDETNQLQHDLSVVRRLYAEAQGKIVTLEEEIKKTDAKKTVAKKAVAKKAVAKKIPELTLKQKFARCVKSANLSKDHITGAAVINDRDLRMCDLKYPCSNYTEYNVCSTLNRNMLGRGFVNGTIDCFVKHCKNFN